ncbi:hypothetical protein [Enterococcus mediterraneensis]|uniref:hypothetical protein n=1 Tax=Enterococcus mediterraneensis TaxID=2364791 RepID=UPI000F06479C|nr:hypothetical protein [Enterococcus mediterraneensis]
MENKQFLAYLFVALMESSLSKKEIIEVFTLTKKVLTEYELDYVKKTILTVLGEDPAPENTIDSLEFEKVMTNYFDQISLELDADFIESNDDLDDEPVFIEEFDLANTEDLSLCELIDGDNEVMTNCDPVEAEESIDDFLHWKFGKDSSNG